MEVTKGPSFKDPRVRDMYQYFKWRYFPSFEDGKALEIFNKVVLPSNTTEGKLRAFDRFLPLVRMDATALYTQWNAVAKEIDVKADIPKPHLNNCCDLPKFHKRMKVWVENNKLAIGNIEVLKLSEGAFYGTMPKFLVKALSGLRALYIADEGPASVKVPMRDSSWIGGLPSVQKLTISWRLMDAVPQEIARLEKLEELEIINDSLTTVDFDFSRLPRLMRVTLRCGGLKSFPQSLCRCSSLEELYIVGGAYVSIPNEVSNLPKLREIKLDVEESRKRAMNADVRIIWKNFMSYPESWRFPSSTFQGHKLPIKDTKLACKLFPGWVQENRGILGDVTEMLIPEDEYSGYMPLSVVPYLKKLETLWIGIDDSTALKPSSENMRELEDQDWLSALPNLKELYLYRNGLIALPRCLPEIKTLKRLEVISSQFKGFAENLVLEQVQEFYIHSEVFLDHLSILRVFPRARKVTIVVKDPEIYPEEILNAFKERGVTLTLRPESDICKTLPNPDECRTQ